jgi:hypothetical protein
MADTQTAPSLPEGNIAAEESIDAAHNAILGLLGSDEEEPRNEEAQPTEEEESTEEPDESLDEVSEDEELEEESEEDESEESDEESDDEEALYAVRIDGEEHEVTLGELVKGYSRQSDYTKKTQALSEQRREFDEASAAHQGQMQTIQQERQQYIGHLENIINNSKGAINSFANINWEELKVTDPVQYVTKREELRTIQDRIQQMHVEQQRASERVAQENTVLQAQTLRDEHQALTEKMPEWSTPETQATISASIREYASVQGFTEEELSSLVDHRSLIVLHKAMQFDNLQSSDIGKKKLQNKPRLVRAGKGSSKDGNKKTKRTAQMKRLQATGHVDDSVSLFEDFVEL